MRFRELQLLTEAIASFEDWVERERSAKRLSNHDRIRHIKDWMSAKNVSIQSLQNYTFDRALKKSEEWSDMLQSQSARKKFTEKQGDRTIEYEDNEWLILSPKTPDAACRYSAGTKWCTSHVNTAIKYMKKGPLYIAISKTKTKPHPEVEGEMIPIKYQFQIESNQYMDDEDKPVGVKNLPEALRKFLVGKGAMKLMTEKEINSYMSKRRVWKGDLNLEDTPITQLPDGLNVVGYLNLFGSPITQLPDGLKVGGDLDLSNTQITQLPDGLKVGGDLFLYKTPITQLPDGLEVGGEIYR